MTHLKFINGYFVGNKWTVLQYLNDINKIATLLIIFAFGLHNFSSTARMYNANITHPIHVIPWWGSLRKRGP
jgi:hypothetical protein